MLITLKVEDMMWEIRLVFRGNNRLCSKEKNLKDDLMDYMRKKVSEK